MRLEVETGGTGWRLTQGMWRQLVGLFLLHRASGDRVPVSVSPTGPAGAAPSVGLRQLLLLPGASRVLVRERTDLSPVLRTPVVHPPFDRIVGQPNVGSHSPTSMRAFRMVTDAAGMGRGQCGRSAARELGCFCGTEGRECDRARRAQGTRQPQPGCRVRAPNQRHVTVIGSTMKAMNNHRRAGPRKSAGVVWSGS